MINFYDGLLTDILKAHSITDDPAMQALSFALREGTRLLYDYSQLCYVYCRIDTMPGKIVDLLAAELRTQYYDGNFDIDTKRALVRNTLIWYMTAGTPAAVEELVAVVFGEGEVKEWFEYGAEPYWFKIITNATLTEDIFTYFIKMLRSVKNTRSHIDTIEVHRKIDINIFAGACALACSKPAAIMDGYIDKRETSQTIHTGSTGVTYFKPVAIMDELKTTSEISETIYPVMGEFHQAGSRSVILEADIFAEDNH